MTLEEFCVRLKQLKLSQPNQAVAILWFLDSTSEGCSRTSGELSRAIKESGLGNPHSTTLGKAILGTKHVLKKGDGFRIKPTSRDEVATWIKSILEPIPRQIDHDNGFIPMAIWKGTRGYLEKIAEQINCCYEFKIYDGASVLARRLVETLLIECYEKLGISNKIKNNGGDYLMLGDIVVRAVDQGQLTLGRDSKRVLKEVKTIGDRAAHNRRYNATKADLDNVRLDLRLLVEELLHLSGMK